MNWRHLVDEAIDEGFKKHIGHLFGVLATDPTDQNLERFKKGVENAKTAYEKIVTALEM